MVGGLDRYYQIARCFRDEELRADRQPEFTQIDLEMSFVEPEDVLKLVEEMVVRGMLEGFGIEVPTPFEQLSYQEAISRFGSDKPDLRFGMELVDITELASRSEFKVFSQTVKDGGIVKGLVVTGQAENFSRKDIDGLGTLAGDHGAKGLAWAKITADGVTGSISKFFGGEQGQELIAAMAAKPKDLLLFVADRTSVVHRAAGWGSPTHGSSVSAGCATSRCSSTTRIAAAGTARTIPSQRHWIGTCRISPRTPPTSCPRPTTCA